MQLSGKRVYKRKFYPSPGKGTRDLESKNYHIIFRKSFEEKKKKKEEIFVLLKIKSTQENAYPFKHLKWV